MSGKTHNGWGEMLGPLAYLGSPDVEGDYSIVTYDQLLSDYKHYLHACHAMIFAKDDRQVFDGYQVKGAVMMQMRHDGYIGFPGGMVQLEQEPENSNESLEEGLNRELLEEIGFDCERHSFTPKDHLISHVHKMKKLCLNFYLKEVTLEEFEAMETSTIKAAHYGSEVLGPLRPPLYTQGDGMRGFPIFLAQRFIGHARQQLLYGLQVSQLLSEGDLQTAMENSKLYEKSISS